MTDADADGALTRSGYIGVLGCCRQMNSFIT